jgi:hypothetical protein
MTRNSIKELVTKANELINLLRLKNDVSLYSIHTGELEDWV